MDAFTGSDVSNLLSGSKSGSSYPLSNLIAGGYLSNHDRLSRIVTQDYDSLYKDKIPFVTCREFVLNPFGGNHSVWALFFDDNVSSVSKTTFYVKCSSASYTMSG